MFALRCLRMPELRQSGIRVRASGYVDPRFGCMVYRIEDASGRVLRRISGARDPQEARARYWRIVGMPLVTPGPDRTSRPLTEPAMAPRRSKSTIQDPELPFDPLPVEAPARTRKTTRNDRAVQVGDAPAQEDLFAAAVIPQAPVQDTPLARSDPAPVIPQRIDYRTLGPADRPDGYLYFIARPAEAEAAVRHGLPVSTSDPVILTERDGVPYWLSVLDEQHDDPGNAPEGIVVLRLRRTAVDDLLEPDPDASSSAGCPCWLLTGNGADR